MTCSLMFLIAVSRCCGFPSYLVTRACIVRLPFFAPPAYCWAMRSEPRKPEPKAEVTPEANASAHTFAERSRTQPGLPTGANPDRARVAGVSRDDFPKAAVLVLAISPDDPAVIETARAYETAMTEAIRTSVDFLRKYLKS